jgi:glutathione transport system substrate-binding protein
MKEPCMNFLALLAGACSQPWFLAPECVNKDGSITHPIGTGPFEFMEWKPGDHFKVKKFNEYWEKGQPYLDEVVVKSIPDKNVLLAALRTGEVHIAVRLPIEQVVMLARRPHPDFRFEFNLDASAHVIFNIAKPPFNDVRVRRAIAYAIKKEELLKGIYYGHGEASAQFFGKRSPWYCDVSDIVQDRAKAKALLAEAGYPDGLDVTAIATRHYLYMGKSCEILQQQLKEIGIKVTIQLLDVPSLLRKIFKGDFTFTVGGFPEYGDPDFFYRNYLTPKGHLAFFHGRAYNNPQVTAWLEKATQVSDFDERKRLYCKVVKTVNEDYPVIFTTRGETATGISNKVKGFKSHVARLDRYSGGGLHYTWLEE